MKTTILPIVTIFLFLTINSIAQEPNPIETIEKIKISSNILLEIERSEKYTLDIKSPDLDISCLINTIEDGVLTLKKTSSFDCIGKVTAKLCCPFIKEIEIMGNAEVSTFNVLKTDTLKIVQRNGGIAYLDLDVDYLEVQLAEGSILSASGYANTQVVDVSTSATFSAFELEGINVDIETSFGGKGKVCATDKLKALAKIGGYISYKCDPVTVESEKKGNGTIEKMSD